MFDMLSRLRRTARFMILPARYVVAAETGTSTSASSVSRQLSQRAPARQLTIRSGSRTTRPRTVFRPWLSDSMSFVNRASSSAEPCSLNLARSSARVLR